MLDVFRGEKLLGRSQSIDFTQMIHVGADLLPLCGFFSAYSHHMAIETGL